jgi:uncharacterized protein (DUF305 family)
VGHVVPCRKEEVKTFSRAAALARDLEGRFVGRGKSIRNQLVAAILGAAVVTGCSPSGTAEDAGGTTTAGAGDVKVIQPGRPGEAAETVDPQDVETESEWNHADVAFVQMMVPHHDQALEMSRLAASRASDERVLSLARRIRGAQGPEIIELAAWLDERNIDVPRAGDDPEEYDHGPHGHGSMAGMLTEQQMDELAAASGRRFDRLFLHRMIGHHEGAIAMADDVAGEGADVRVAEIAADVATGQSAEIRTMRELLGRL